MLELRLGRKVVSFTHQDLDAAREFYVGRLGLSIEREDPGTYFLLDLGSVQLCIDLADDQSPARGGGATLLVEVPNLRRFVDDLDARGIPYVRERGEHQEYLLVEDPEGYKLVFAEQL